MPPSKSAAEKERKPLTGSSWKPPKCNAQRETQKGRMTGREGTPMEYTCTAAASGEGRVQPPPYKYDRLPSLDDEPAGGLRWVSNFSVMH